MIEREIVDTEEVPAEVLAGFREMVEVAARVVLACVAVTVGVDGLFRKFVHGARQLEFSLRSEDRAALGELGGNDTVKHVHAAMDGFEEIDGGTDAHEIARNVLWKVIGNKAGELVALGVGLPDSEAADGETVETERAQELGALLAEIMVAGALHDAEEGLFRITTGAEGALGPAVGEQHRGLGLRVAGGRGDTLVEHHHDVAADGPLHSDARFRREEERLAIDVALEVGAFLLHRAFGLEGEDLKAAGVGEHGPVPLHEIMDTAKFLKHLGAGTEEEVIGVGEDDVGAGCLEGLDRLAFDRGLSADGHEDRRVHFAVQRLVGGRARFRTGGFLIEREIETRHGFGWAVLEWGRE